MPAFMNTRRKIILIILLLIAYAPVLMWMAQRWFEPGSYYSHGLLIPLASLFLIWEKKEKLNKIPRNSSSGGLKIFIFGILLYWGSAFMHIYFSAGFSILFVISGLVLFFYGKKMFRELLFPILFLIFMIPLPLIVVAFICFKLKILVAQLATLLLNIFQIQALVQASLIQMPHSSVIVENACGGLRSLISLTALGALFAYTMQLKFNKKVILFISAIPIAVITNSLRIVFLAAVGEIYGTQYTQPEGVLHNLSGCAVFLFAFLSLLTVERFLK